MDWQFTPFTIPLVLAALVGVSATYAVGRDRDSPAETWATAVQASIFVWISLHLLIVSTATYSVKVAALSLIVPTTMTLVVAMFGFTLYYTGRRELLTDRTRVALLALPFAATGLSLTNRYHRQVFVDPRLDTSGAFVQLTYEWGPGFVAIAAVNYLLIGAFCVLLYRKVRHSRNVYRTKSALVFGSMVILASATVASTLDVSPFPHYMLMPLLYLFVGVVLVLATVSMRFVHGVPTEKVTAFLQGGAGGIVPHARDVVTEELDGGIVVLDDAGHVVDANSAGKAILDVDRAVGRRVSDIVDPEIIDERSELHKIVSGEGDFRELREEVWVSTPSGDRCYDTTISPLGDTEGTVVGYVVLVYDITRQKRRERRLREREEQLERRTAELQRETAKLTHQNERLDEFASIISHDLRNPLNVANGRLEHATADLDGPEDTTEIDGETVDAIKRSHRRIERIIEDTLTLAREGQVITETEPVSLEAIASDAWNNVETPDATLGVAADATIDGDRGRLLTLFENLFRNAIEHSEDGVTVRVEPLSDRSGFAVEDDGPGIPEDRREDVLAYGYSTNDEGTGLGLSIVSDIVAAHGWTIEVTDARFPAAQADGDETGGGPSGTRFEIGGFESADDAE